MVEQEMGLPVNSLQGKKEGGRTKYAFYVCLGDGYPLLKISFALLENVNMDFSSNMHWNLVIKLRARSMTTVQKDRCLLRIEYFAYLTFTF